MNHYRILVTIILSALLSPVLASEVTLPHTFSAGQKARAAQVNNNFTAVKDAVDDNHDRITELESQIKKEGAVSIPAQAFNDISEISSSTCVFKQNQEYDYFDNTDDSCIAGAGLALPDGATITGGGCIVYDNAADSSISVLLYRSDIDITPDTILVFISSQSSDEPVLSQALNISLNGTPDTVVNNLLYAYSIQVAFDIDDLVTHQDLRLYNCTVTYELGD
jgi:hypothetical protein